MGKSERILRAEKINVYIIHNPYSFMAINWKKIFAILVILLIVGVIIAVAIVSIDKANILNKVP